VENLSKSYTAVGLKLWIWTALKPWDSTIVNGSILLILARLRSSNCGSFHAGPNQSFKPTAV